MARLPGDRYLVYAEHVKESPDLKRISNVLTSYFTCLSLDFSFKSIAFESFLRIFVKLNYVLTSFMSTS